MYSGPIAASVYAALRPIAHEIERVVLLGPAHRVYLEGLALPQASHWATPLGTVPIDAPAFLLNKLSMGLFNFALYHKHVPRVRRGIMHPEEFFHPLDKILAWNRCYGRPGFTQYQCVIPSDDGRDGARRFLELLTRSGAASFLCVIKDCGDEGEGLLSFPRPGTSIAVDLPVRRNTAELVARLNECVIAEGGRIYLAKDTFTTAEHFRAMEPRLEEFLAIQSRYDPEGRLASVQSARVMGIGGDEAD